MSSDDGSKQFDRRTVLKGAAASGGLLAAAAGTASAAPQQLDIQVVVGVGFSESGVRSVVEAAADDIESGANVSIDVEDVHRSDHSYGGSYSDIMDDFRNQESSHIGTGQVNLLMFEDLAPPITGCNHQGAMDGQNRPSLTYVNAWFLQFGTRTFKNLIITAILRPILGDNLDRAPDSSDVNSFGTIYTGWLGNNASPMATWHEPRAIHCPSPADLDDIVGSGDDHVEAICDGEGDAITDDGDIPTACGHSGELSECSAATLEDHLASL